MGQESGRAAWPRPAGYQTITGRRYGRRHAYISFRPNFKASGRYRNQNPARIGNWEGQTRDNLTTEQHIAPKNPLSTMLHSILPVSNSVHPEHRGRTGRDAVGKKQPSSRRLADGPTIHYKKMKSDPPVTPDPQSDSSGGSEMNKKSCFWPETEERLTNSALGFVNIDAYEPDSSGGEEESAGMSEGLDPPPLGQQRRLDSMMIFELGKDFDYLRGLHSFLYTKTDPPPKESAEMDRRAGSNPEGDDATGRLGEWAGERAGSVNDTGERMNDTGERMNDTGERMNDTGERINTGERNNGIGAEADATDEMESRTGAEVEAGGRMRPEVEAGGRMRPEVEAGGRMRARESGAMSGIGDNVETRNGVTSDCQRPSTASAAVVYPVCPPGSLESGAGAFPGTESGWRQLGEWQRLGGSQDSGAWGLDERGAGLDLGAAAGSSACPPEPVVRPKIRKQSSETHLEQKPGSDGSEPAQCGSASRPGRPARTGTQAKCVSAPPFFLTQTDRPNPELLFSFPPAERIREEEERMREWLERKTEGLRRDGEEEEEEKEEEEEEEGCRLDSDDDDIWEDLDVFNDKTAPFIKAEDSSECSEGEWFWPSDSGLDKERGSSKEERDSSKEERRSSEESRETLPGLERSAEISSTSGSLEEPAPLSTDTGDPQPQLEEGEVPWLMYNQEASSSEDEEGPDPGSHFVHPGLFILDGNNNMDDDSSMSEDLDAEWRLLDDFGDGFGMAQAISSYVDPQLLTYMALEERLAQAMEAALAHLESLAIDVEQAHPPATEQIINCLPHITIQEENSGQEQCCAICCSEYVREEVATQLPCNHMFHKLCVTLWLQKSGTCPVCRHILTPPLPEAPPPTSFLSDQEVPPSNHSTAGTR